MFDSDNTVLVIGAHPDDEVLGVGGTLAKHSALGDEVHILIITEGASHQYPNTDLIEQKRREAKNCANRLGAKEVHFGDLPDMRLDDTPHVEINSVIEQTCSEVEPDIVYTHSRREINRDHIEVHDSTLVATRPTSGISTVLAYETPSSTDYSTNLNGFTPNLFVDITDYIDTKIEAFEQYESEIRDYPHSRSVDALRSIAKTRGVASGSKAAEAFEILRSYR